MMMLRHRRDIERTANNSKSCFFRQAELVHNDDRAKSELWRWWKRRGHAYKTCVEQALR